MRQFCLIVAMIIYIGNIYAQVNLDSGLVAYYPFNGNANDESGNGNDGTVFGGVLLTADRFGNDSSAYEFNNNPTHGTQAVDYIIISDNQMLRPINGITLLAWIKTSNPAGRSIVGKRFKVPVGTGYEDSYILWYDIGTLWFTLYPYSGAGVSNPVPALNEWHLLIGTWDGSNIRLYVDAIEVSNRPYSGPNEYDDSPLVIGADNDDSDELPDDGWDGLIDDVRIYNRALNLEEIDSLFNEQPTSIDITNFDIPVAFELYQNYPNPFNPSTKISYSLPNTSFVTLKIYDMLGKEIQTIMKEVQISGTYTIDFDADKFPSGIYLYSLQAGKFSATKKMLLLK